MNTHPGLQTAAHILQEPLVSLALSFSSDLGGSHAVQSKVVRPAQASGLHNHMVVPRLDAIVIEKPAGFGTRELGLVLIGLSW